MSRPVGEPGCVTLGCAVLGIAILGVLLAAAVVGLSVRIIGWAA